MILVRLQGGLGNQLFQYAAARRLAHARGAELRLDVSALDDPRYRTARRYELGALNVAARIAQPEDLARVAPAPRGLAGRVRERLAGGAGRLRHVREAHFHFDPAVLALPDGVYLDGYWQSPRYFADVADLIRGEAAPKAPLSGRNAELAKEIEGCAAVSVHVRRGDYLTDPAVLATHGVCAPEYYEKALAYVAGRVAEPVFFVFGDDPEWAKAHLKAPGRVVIVDPNGPEHPAEDLRLMRLCRHHVIANSTFGWWGAWLNPRPEKVVVAPERWFATDRTDTRDLIPADWVRR
jgi:Glycosyl transferase family 11